MLTARALCTNRPGCGPKLPVKCRAASTRVSQSTFTKEELTEYLSLEGTSKLPDTAELAQALETDLEEGLATSAGDRSSREARYGANRLPKERTKTFVELLAEAFDDFTIQVLSAAGALSLVLQIFLVGDENGWLEGAAILGAVAVVVLVTAVSNYQKEQQFRELDAIKKDVKARVVRDGTETTCSASDLLVGDLLVVEAGDILPVDGVLVSGSDIKVNESHLTGEAEDVPKGAGGDLKLFAGSLVMEGWGRMLVLAVGTASQQGLISVMTQQGGPQDGVEATSVLVGQLEDMAGAIGRLGLGAATLTTGLMAATYLSRVAGTGQLWEVETISGLLQCFIVGITVLVVAVPEGLPLAVTLALAYSVKRLYADNNLVRRLDACEALGCTTTICTDKTGTLTKSEMEVVRLWAGGKLLGGAGTALTPVHLPDLDAAPSVTALLRDAILSNSTAQVQQRADGSWEDTGNRTECALLRMTARISAAGNGSGSSNGSSNGAGAPPSPQDAVAAFTFTSDRKCMSVVMEGGAGRPLRCFTKGAAELMLDRCTSQLNTDGEVVPLTQQQRAQLGGNVGQDALRMLCVCYRDLEGQEGAAPGDLTAEGCEQDLTLIAMVGIQDNLRPGIADAIRAVQTAGITVKMLTGDNLATATAVARQAAILPQEASDVGAPPPGGVCMEGPDFRRLVTAPDGGVDAAAFADVWPALRVLARCSPQDKYLLVQGCRGLEASQGYREVIAMTGDGSNDAPALRLAAVGLAMASGTTIAKDASDIVLLDDNFASIESGVKWGRNVYDSVVKFLQFQLTINGVAVVTACVGAGTLAEAPLTAIQMLWVNLIMDSLASLALATEAPPRGPLQGAPHRSDEALITPTVAKHIGGQFLYQLAVLGPLVAAGEQWAGWGHDTQLTMVFNAFVCMQLTNQLNARKLKDEPDVLEDLGSSRVFLGILGMEVLLQIAIVQFGAEAFRTVPLTPAEWGACLGFGGGSLIVRRVLASIPNRRVPFLDRVGDVA